jgi:hypothetical protein
LQDFLSQFDKLVKSLKMKLSKDSGYLTGQLVRGELGEQDGSGPRITIRYSSL